MNRTYDDAQYNNQEAAQLLPPEDQYPIMMEVAGRVAAQHAMPPPPPEQRQQHPQPHAFIYVGNNNGDEPSVISKLTLDRAIHSSKDDEIPSKLYVPKHGGDDDADVDEPSFGDLDHRLNNKQHEETEDEDMRQYRMLMERYKVLKEQEAASQREIDALEQQNFDMYRSNHNNDGNHEMMMMNDDRRRPQEYPTLEDLEGDQMIEEEVVDEDEIEADDDDDEQRGLLTQQTMQQTAEDREIRTNEDYVVEGEEYSYTEVEVLDDEEAQVEMEPANDRRSVASGGQVLVSSSSPANVQQDGEFVSTSRRSIRPDPVFSSSSFANMKAESFRDEFVVSKKSLQSAANVVVVTQQEDHQPRGTVAFADPMMEEGKEYGYDVVPDNGDRKKKRWYARRRLVSACCFLAGVITAFSILVLINVMDVSIFGYDLEFRSSGNDNANQTSESSRTVPVVTDPPTPIPTNPPPTSSPISSAISQTSAPTRAPASSAPSIDLSNVTAPGPLDLTVSGEINGAESGFGSSVAMSGSWLVVGTSASNNGKVSTLFRDGNTWSPVAPELEGTAGSAFGASVDLGAVLDNDDIILAVGAPEGGTDGMGAVYLFINELDGSGSWQALLASPLSSSTTPTQRQRLLTGELPDRFGTSVAVSSNMRVVVGAPDGGNDVGSVHVFHMQRVDGAVELASSHALFGSAQFSQFGAAVDITPDGSAVAVGVSGQSSFIVYEWSASEWTNVFALSSAQDIDLGSSVAFLSDNYLAVGAPSTDSNSGRVRIFKRSGNTWAETQSISGNRNDRLGTFGTVSGTEGEYGPELVVSTASGGLKRFDLFGGSWYQRFAEFRASTATSVAAWDDGVDYSVFAGYGGASLASLYEVEEQAQEDPITGTPTLAPTTGDEPSCHPTCSPTSVPTAQTNQPTSAPVPQPSATPSQSPSSQPSTSPQARPSSTPSTPAPTHAPTVSTSPSLRGTTRSPTAQPITTATPTALPSSAPSDTPSSMPSSTPSSVPSSTPSAYPTSLPSFRPTRIPSCPPSSTPTKEPTTPAPTKSPTPKPTPVPPGTPTPPPTRSPSATPTASASPTKSPSSKPTGSPTRQPTTHPTSAPVTGQPTTPLPTTPPTVGPTKSPTAEPTHSPTAGPTQSPSASPTPEQHTHRPTLPPTQMAALTTQAPTSTPSDNPTTPMPSSSPTKSPTTSGPTHSPTEKPTAAPTKSPTTATPTSAPTKHPTTTATPTVSPTRSPTTDQPTSNPTGSPTSRPTDPPTNTPTDPPTNTPTRSPTQAPITQSPTQSPTSVPTASPVTSSPTALPSWQLVGGPFTGAGASSEHGSSVAIAGDYMVAGEPEGSSVGQVRIYRENPSWHNISSVIDLTAQSFGSAVDLAIISGQPSLLVGAKDTEDVDGTARFGSAAFYQFDNQGVWSQLGSVLTPGTLFIDGGGEFGAKVAMASTVRRIAVSAPESAASVAHAKSGKVYTYEYDGSDWVQMADPLYTEAQVRFGSAIDMSADGSRLLVGAPRGASGDGQVFFYSYNSGTNSWERETGLRGGAGEAAGTSVAIANSAGTMVAFGAPNHGNNQGIIRVYFDLGGFYVDSGSQIVGLDGERIGTTLCGANGRVAFGTDTGTFRVVQSGHGGWTEVAAGPSLGSPVVSISMNESADTVVVGLANESTLVYKLQ